MSASNAAALRRRVGNQSNPPRPGAGSATSSIPTSNNTTTSAKQSGMTLQEVISRLSTEDQNWILGKTAMNFYSLQIESPESHTI